GELEGVTPPRFAFTITAAVVSPKTLEPTATLLSDYAGPTGDPVVGTSADGKSAWVATDIIYMFPCGMEGCDKIIPPRVHASGLVDAPHHGVAWHVGEVDLGSQRPPSPKRGKPVAPAALTTGIDAGAEEAVRLFRASLADPKALGKTVADRKDVVL